jgi:hypothetical protein
MPRWTNRVEFGRRRHQGLRTVFELIPMKIATILFFHVVADVLDMFHVVTVAENR